METDSLEHVSGRRRRIAGDEILGHVGDGVPEDGDRQGLWIDGDADGRVLQVDETVDVP